MQAQAQVQVQAAYPLARLAICLVLVRHSRWCNPALRLALPECIRELGTGGLQGAAHTGVGSALAIVGAGTSTLGPHGTLQGQPHIWECYVSSTCELHCYCSIAQVSWKLSQFAGYAALKSTGRLCSEASSWGLMATGQHVCCEDTSQVLWQGS